MQLTDWSNLDLIFGVVKHQGWCSYPFINGLQARSEPVSLLAGIKRPRNTFIAVISDSSHNRDLSATFLGPCTDHFCQNERFRKT